MRKLKIAVSDTLTGVFESVRDQVPVSEADWMEVSAAVLSEADLQAGKLQDIEALHLNIPVFAVSQGKSTLPMDTLYGVID